MRTTSINYFDNFSQHLWMRGIWAMKWCYGFLVSVSFFIPIAGIFLGFDINYFRSAEMGKWRVL